MSVSSAQCALCDGCGRGFTRRGLSQHLSKTRNTRCRRLLLKPYSDHRPILNTGTIVQNEVSQDLTDAHFVRSQEGKSL